jgi:hypothetical protein
MLKFRALPGYTDAAVYRAPICGAAYLITQDRKHPDSGFKAVFCANNGDITDVIRRADYEIAAAACEAHQSTRGRL